MPGGASAAPTPWAVICEAHGRVYLTQPEYQHQLWHRPNMGWQCPIGKCRASWDIQTFEAHLRGQDGTP